MRPFAALCVAVVLVAALCGTGLAAGARAKRKHRPPPVVLPCRPVGPHFHTRPDIRLAGVCVGARRKGIAPGYVMVTTRTGRTGHNGLVLFDNAGEIVWYQARPHDVNDLKVVRYQGQRMLAWHEYGPTPDGGSGSYYFMNSHYQIVKQVDLGPGIYTDMHEMQLTRRGTVLLGARPDYVEQGTGQKIRNYIVREVDPNTGARLFDWVASDRLPLSYSYFPRPSKHGRLWEPYHGNSIREMRDGNLLVSLRNTSAVYKLDRHTGNTIWTLGGLQDSFDLVSKHPAWQFCNQHDASELPNGHILIFDDGGSGTACPDHPARALEFALDTVRHTVRLVAQYSSKAATANGRGYHAWYVGSARRLSNGDTIVSWGQVPHVTEFTRGGRVNFDMTLGTWTYRALRDRWVGRPLDKPAVAAKRSKREVTVWASWNGATQVRSWSVFAGKSPTSLVRVAPAVRRKTGFETTLSAPPGAAFVFVRANDAHGTALGDSQVIAVPPR